MDDSKDEEERSGYIATGINFFACTLFLICTIKLSVYIPTLLNTATANLPGYDSTLSNSDYVDKSFAIVFGTIGFGNPMFLLSSFFMTSIGLFLFSCTNDKRNKSIWKKTVITAFSIAGVLVTIFSVRGI